MSRNAFRSQPTLQRTHGPAPRWALPLAGVAVIVVGLLAFSRAMDVARIEAPEPPPPPAPQAAPAVRPAPAPLVQTAAAVQPPVAPSVKVQKAVMAAKAPHPAAKPLRIAAALSLAQADKAQRDYRQAMDEYARRERSAGFEWARQNKVTVRDYCRSTSTRTAAFMQGCMAYLETATG